MLERQQETASQPASGKLTQDELTGLLNEAIRRSGQAEVRREQMASLATLDDALAIAREAGIPPEHVLEAAAELQRRKRRGGKGDLGRAQRGAAVLFRPGLRG